MIAISPELISATSDGSSIVRPATDPIWIQFIARLRSDRAVSSATVARCAGGGPRHHSSIALGLAAGAIQIS